MEKIEEVEVLQEKYITPDCKHDGKFSKTAQFMIPAIGINVINPLVFKYFVNAYLTDVEHKHSYERPVFLLFSIKSFKENDWNKVYSILTKSPNYITEYDIGIQNNKHLLMIVFKIPEIFKEDYINFRLGRYSLFSEEYKKKFPEYLNTKEKDKNLHWQIINKDEELKRKIEKIYNMEEGDLDKTDVKNGVVYSGPAIEIWDKPDKKREYYRYNCDSPSL